ncbi:NAD-dependent epimerase/dehydratase family protein [Poseidonibacter lekithochrous]|uniref:NAD-dependent epimerase/dehydratase family protein n=1 Tax=Poseidonibacter lekithochrous TaxID=1904463 RepID=UPI000B12CE52
MKVLVIGDAGYIGSHTLIELDKSGFNFVVFDNLCNSSLKSLKRVEKTIGKTIGF